MRLKSGEFNFYPQLSD